MQPTATVLVYSDDANTREQVKLAAGRRPAADVPPVEFLECATLPAVLSALDRLDRRVEDLSHEADAEQRSTRPARAAPARALRRSAPPQTRDEWNEDWRNETYQAPRDPRREAGYDTRHAAAYDEREPDYDDRPHDGYDDARAAAAAPRGD